MAKRQNNKGLKARNKARVTDEQAEFLARQLNTIALLTDELLVTLDATGGYKAIIGLLTNQKERCETLANRFMVQADTEESRKLKVQRKLAEYKAKAAELGIDE